jgi:hypothetical protein
VQIIGVSFLCNRGGAIEVEVDIADAESRRYCLLLRKGGEDDDEGEHERIRE